jgi:hypothetical protein
MEEVFNGVAFKNSLVVFVLALGQFESRRAKEVG